MSRDFDNTKPIYYQLMHRFFHKICSGHIQPGEKLPSVRETAVDAGVNPNTVQRTYMEMERMGVVESKRGQGTFVVNEPDVIKQLRLQLAEEQMDSFIEEMKSIGFTPPEILQRLQTKITEKGE
ncbi:GntR family transcriptional regulator [Alkalihalobacterium sp. APHAB7]|uniref:GntR family transcriptional regulator n=1 Tax=Alkalihalobacterium sp. APHAB7 TaxID=3402081 RepID=UPI003AABAA53